MLQISVYVSYKMIWWLVKTWMVWCEWRQCLLWDESRFLLLLLLDTNIENMFLICKPQRPFSKPQSIWGSRTSGAASERRNFLVRQLEPHFYRTLYDFSSSLIYVCVCFFFLGFGNHIDSVICWPRLVESHRSIVFFLSLSRSIENNHTTNAKRSFSFIWKFISKPK